MATVVRLAVGLALLSAGPSSFVLASDDGDAYVAAARWAASGEPIVLDERLANKWSPDADPATRWPAGYWLFLGLQYCLFGYQHVSSVVLQALVGGAGAWAAYALARRMLPDRWSVVAGILCAASSTLVYLGAALYAEALYIPLLLLGLTLLVRARWASTLAAGVALGLAEATRPLALPVLLVAAAWYIWRGQARLALPLICGFALALSPFVARDLLVVGHLTVFTAGGEAAFHDTGVGHLGQDLQSLGVDPYATGLPGSLAAALSHPVEITLAIASAIPERLAVLFLVGGWSPLGEPLLSLFAPTPIVVAARSAFWAMCAFGACALLRQRRTRHVAALLVLVALAVVLPPLVLGLPLVRYRAPADPIFLITFTAALVRLWRPRCDLNARPLPPQGDRALVGRGRHWSL